MWRTRTSCKTGRIRCFATNCGANVGRGTSLLRGRVTKIINNDALTCHGFGFVSFLTGDINLHDALSFVASLSINCSDFPCIYWLVPLNLLPWACYGVLSINWYSQTYRLLDLRFQCSHKMLRCQYFGDYLSPIRSVRSREFSYCILKI